MYHCPRESNMGLLRTASNAVQFQRADPERKYLLYLQHLKFFLHRRGKLKIHSQRRCWKNRRNADGGRAAQGFKGGINAPAEYSARCARMRRGVSNRSKLCRIACALEAGSRPAAAADEHNQSPRDRPETGVELPLG